MLRHRHVQNAVLKTCPPPQCKRVPGLFWLHLMQNGPLSHDRQGRSPFLVILEVLASPIADISPFNPLYYVEAKGSKAQQSIYLYAQQSKRQRINQQKGSERWVKSCCNLESKAQNWKLLQSWAKSTKIENGCNLNQKAQNELESGCNLNQKSTEREEKRLRKLQSCKPKSKAHRMNFWKAAAAIWIKFKQSHAKTQNLAWKKAAAAIRIYTNL